MKELAHLSETAASKLTLSSRDRIQHIKKARWIGYGRAREILGKLEDLLVHPPQARMPNMLIVGETNNGKTMLVSKFREKHPAEENRDGDAISIPVLYIQAPPGPDERGLYNAILSRLFEVSPRSEATDAKRDRVVEVLRRVKLGMLMVDEIHHLLAGAYVKQRNCLNVLKYLGNELCVPLVGVGTAEAMRAIQTDPQLANRFTPEILPKWTKNAELARLLASFERVIPLQRVSQLASPALAARIVDIAGGTIGEMSTLLNMAAIRAIETGEECITAEMLEGCGYVSPVQRKQAASAL
ncbi:TniB family NTP-binding protein [Ralstonia pseudosolanacearum]|uniref:TniB family NTP-binding protein n=1 Tax=Ralstonia pseudosolanacearum TaxID=1310165 RepID=UPI0033933658